MGISTLPPEILRITPLLQAPSEAKIKSHERKALLWEIAAIASLVAITILAALTLYLLSTANYVLTSLGLVSLPVAISFFNFCLDESKEHRAWLNESKDLTDKVHTLEAMSNEELKTIHVPFNKLPLNETTKTVLRDTFNKDSRDINSSYRVLIPLIARLQIANENTNKFLKSTLLRKQLRPFRIVDSLCKKIESLALKAISKKV